MQKDVLPSLSCCLFAQLCLTLCDLMPSSPVSGISQASILEWDAIAFSGDLPDPRIEPASVALQILYQYATGEALSLSGNLLNSSRPLWKKHCSWKRPS